MPEPNFRLVTAADRDDLARFLSGHRWPFHARARLDPVEAAEVVAGWDLEGRSRAWWLERDGRVVGLLRVDDLDTRWDPSWDLRVAEGHRGVGVGTAAVRRLAGEVFGGWPDQDGVVHDGIGYALLREDWEQGKTTPVDWDGE
jgi:RimJ/RimL family protein N-acetyltransferase